MTTPADLQPSPAPRTDAPSRGGPAPEGVLVLSERTRRDDLNAVTVQGFVWMAQAASDQITKLHGEITAKDEPDWVGSLVEVAIELAVGAGAAAVGEKIAAKLVKPVGDEVNEVNKEFVKALFEEGIHAGIGAGRDAVGAKHEGSLDGFIESQRDAARGTHSENQRNFLLEGQHRVHTVNQAAALAAACSEANVKEAAAAHHDAVRDSWLSYLAQHKFGASWGLTNMTDDTRRSKSNEYAPGTEAPEGPSPLLAIKGEAPGVLVMDVALPTIYSGVMSGTPEVKLAILNGVNKKVRAQYEGRALASSSIPRLIRAFTAGGDSFILSLDEAGGLVGAHHNANAWLIERSAVSRPEAFSLSDYDRIQLGLKLLLEELVPEEIH